MEKRRKVLLVVLLLISSVAIFSLRQRDLTIHLVSESPQPSVAMSLTLDGEEIFKGEVESGVYWNEKLVIKDVGVGLHDLKVVTLDGRVYFESIDFYFLNKTLIVTYQDSDIPHIDRWSQFGAFLPD